MALRRSLETLEEERRADDKVNIASYQADKAKIYSSKMSEDEKDKAMEKATTVYRLREKRILDKRQKKLNAVFLEHGIDKTCCKIVPLVRICPLDTHA